MLIKKIGELMKKLSIKKLSDYLGKGRRTQYTVFFNDLGSSWDWKILSG